MAQAPAKDPKQWLAKEDKTPGPEPERPGEEITDPNSPDYSYKKYADGTIEITRAPKGTGHEGTKLTNGVAFDAINALFEGTPTAPPSGEPQTQMEKFTTTDEPIVVEGSPPKTKDDKMAILEEYRGDFFDEEGVPKAGRFPAGGEQYQPELGFTSTQFYDKEDPVPVTGDPSERFGFTKNAYGVPDAEEVSAWAMEQHKHESVPPTTTDSPTEVTANEELSDLTGMRTEDIEEALSRELRSGRSTGGAKRSRYIKMMRDILSARRKETATDEPLSYSSQAVADRVWSE